MFALRMVQSVMKRILSNTRGTRGAAATTSVCSSSELVAGWNTPSSRAGSQPCDPAMQCVTLAARCSRRRDTARPPGACERCSAGCEPNLVSSFVPAWQHAAGPGSGFCAMRRVKPPVAFDLLCTSASDATEAQAMGVVLFILTLRCKTRFAGSSSADPYASTHACHHGRECTSRAKINRAQAPSLRVDGILGAGGSQTLDIQCTQRNHDGRNFTTFCKF